MAEFILSQIENRRLIDAAIHNAAKAINMLVKDGIDSAMNKFN